MCPLFTRLRALHASNAYGHLAGVTRNAWLYHILRSDVRDFRPGDSLGGRDPNPDLGHHADELDPHCQ